MAEDEPGEGQPEFAAVLPLPDRAEAEPLTPAELAAAMSGKGLGAAMRYAFGLDE